LPNELLYHIFDDVYKNWSDVKKFKSPLALIAPLSKRLLDIQRSGLYRDITVRRLGGTHSFMSLVRTVMKQRQLAPLIVSLRFDVSDSDSSPISKARREEESSSEEIRDFFDRLVNLRRVILAGSISRTDSTDLTIYASSQAVLSVLAAVVKRPNVKSVSDNQRGYSRHSDPARPGLSRLPLVDRSTTVSQLFIQSRSDYWFWKPSAHVTFTFDDTQSLDSSPSSKRISAHLFSQLKAVTFTDATSEIAAPLLEALHLPSLEEINLEIHSTFPVSSLLTLVAPSTALRSIKLTYTGEVGHIGTRVSTVDFDAAFQGIDLNTEDIAQDAMPDDWTYPQFPSNCPVEDLLLLRKKAQEIGVELRADRLYEAAQVQLAVDEDLELLDELWQKWKKSQKSGKRGGGKSKKSKK